MSAGAHRGTAERRMSPPASMTPAEHLTDHQELEAQRQLLSFFMPETAIRPTVAIEDTQSDFNRVTQHDCSVLPSGLAMKTQPIANASHIQLVPSQSDEQLADRLVDELNRSGVASFEGLSVNVTHGIAHLGGHLGSHYELVIALQLAGRTGGILGVRHSIQVEGQIEEKVGLRDWVRAFRSQFRTEIRQVSRLTLALVVIFTGWSIGHRLFASSGSRTKLVKATGSVRWEGRPVAGAVVRFHSSTLKKTENKWHPQALTDEAGGFALSTFERNDGAPEGEYVVTVICHPDVIGKSSKVERGPNILPEKYARPTSSPLKVRISADHPELPPIQISK